MDKRDFAFGRMNYILLAVGMAVVIIGFLLMSGSGSTDTAYDPDIFSARRIKVAPVVCLLGFVSMIYAVHRICWVFRRATRSCTLSRLSSNLVPSCRWYAFTGSVSSSLTIRQHQQAAVCFRS